MLDVRCHFIVFYCHVFVILVWEMQQKCKHNILTSGKHQNMQTKITPNLGNAQTMQTKKTRKTNATKKTMKTKTCKKTCKNNVNKLTRVLAQNEVFRLPSSAPGRATRAGWENDTNMTAQNRHDKNMQNQTNKMTKHDKHIIYNISYIYILCIYILYYI